MAVANILAIHVHDDTVDGLGNSRGPTPQVSRTAIDAEVGWRVQIHT